MYRIKLYHTIFDKENDNVLLFNSKEELKEYFDNQDFQLFENINFVANNLIETNICLTIDTEESIPLIKILNYNYCIVENMENEEDTLFFFINESKQDSANQIILNLQLDPFNSYYYDIRNLRGLVNRTHLDRLIKRDENYVFNFAEASPLFEREPIQNLSKRPTYKSKLIPILAGEGTNFDNWINENVDHWVYYYISADTKFKYLTSDNNQEESVYPTIKYVYNSGIGIDGSISVIAAPIYKSDKVIKIRSRTSDNIDEWHEWDEKAIKNFISDNSAIGYLYSIKHSILPPFYFDESLNSSIINDVGDLYIPNAIYNNAGYASLQNGITFLTTKRNLVFAVVENQYIEKYLRLKPNYRGKLNAELYKNTFTLDELLYNGNIEPKIYNEDYSTYRLYMGGASYDLPVSKSSNQPNFRYFEILSPDITKAFLTYDAATSYGPFETIFNETTAKDFTGFMLSLDLSMWFSKDELSSWLASNKNNLQIFQNNQRLEREQTKVNNIGNVVSGILRSAAYNSIGPSVDPITNAISSETNLKIKQQIEIENYNLTLDNMRQAPEQLSALNSNFLLMSNVDEFGIYIEIQEPLSFERGKVVDYLKLFGYSYNKIGDVRDFNKTRRYYNYVQALIFEIDGKIAEQVKDYLKSIFAKGIRFWHADTFQSIDFTLNNIERSIYNG